METLTIEVKPYTAPRSMTWFVTWEGIPEGWALAIFNEMFFFPVRRTVTWPDGTTPSIPDNPTVDRKVDIDFILTEKGRYVSYPNKEDAVAFIHRRLRRALRGNEGF